MSFLNFTSCVSPPFIILLSKFFESVQVSGGGGTCAKAAVWVTSPDSLR